MTTTTIIIICIAVPAIITLVIIARNNMKYRPGTGIISATFESYKKRSDDHIIRSVLTARGIFYTYARVKKIKSSSLAPHAYRVEYWTE